MTWVGWSWKAHSIHPTEFSGATWCNYFLLDWIFRQNMRRSTSTQPLRPRSHRSQGHIPIQNAPHAPRWSEPSCQCHCCPAKINSQGWRSQGQWWYRDTKWYPIQVQGLLEIIAYGTALYQWENKTGSSPGTLGIQKFICFRRWVSFCFCFFPSLQI